jgi:hypothetical protein
MTSNLGANFLNASDTEGPISSETKELVHGAIRTHFAPEFINRIDAIIVSIFGPFPLWSLIADGVYARFSTSLRENKSARSLTFGYVNCNSGSMTMVVVLGWTLTKQPKTGWR